MMIVRERKNTPVRASALIFFMYVYLMAIMGLLQQLK